MAENTEISWCDSTQNWWIGCTAISDACTFCYAAALDKRTGGDHWGNVPRRRTSPKNWNEPLRWQKKAAAFFAEHGRKRRVFVSSMSDFYDNQVDPQWRADAWEVIRQCPDLDWLILTKRPQNIRKMLPPFWDEIKDRIWSGTTIEGMDQAMKNIHHLLRIDSRYRFLSCEPLLGPLFLRRIPTSPIAFLDALTGEHYTNYYSQENGPQRSVIENFHTISWVIAGGESGHGARPMHPWWPELLRTDCEATGTAFHYKQAGNHGMATSADKGAFLVEPWGIGGVLPGGGPPPVYMVKTAKKNNDLLYGKRYKAFPNDAD